jgi:phosphogluconate dehydratase
MVDTESALHPVLAAVTERIVERSRESREAYLARIAAATAQSTVARARLGCTNLAHAFAASNADEKEGLRGVRWPNLAIVSAYNDMLSAHQPLERYPALIKRAAREAGAVAQFAGGVPAMCDGVTQGQPGMELSLFSRDVIAMATGVALSHDAFDAVLCLGVCDKIVPGLLIGALAFGHLPTVFVPAGPMPSGLPNAEKARVRREYAEGKVGREALLEAEMQSYHSPGTCTFYGTANSNQFLMEVMGLHVPGAAFVNPGTPLRDALTMEATRLAATITAQGQQHRPIGRIVDERAIANAIVALLATGGSTNHTIHLVAIAAAAGIRIDWNDFDALSHVVPLLARVYPNGKADVNQFQAAGGTGFVIRELLAAGLLHGDVETVVGQGLQAYTSEPWLDDGTLRWRPAPDASGDESIVRTVSAPFSSDGGLRVMRGNLGRAVVKTSALHDDHFVIEAPAIVFEDQSELLAAFKAGKLDRDFVAVVRFQGPRANGMPELHQMTPALTSLQSRGFKVALVTDGRMSGASGPVPAAIHLTPEAEAGGAIARVRTGDSIRFDARAGTLELKPTDERWLERAPAKATYDSRYGSGRELFASFRKLVGDAENGALSCLTARN